MCIFQLPAITGLRTLKSSAELRANLRLDRCSLSNNGFFSRQRHPIPRVELPSSPGFHCTIHLNSSGLDLMFGLSAGAHPSLPFEELIQLHHNSLSGLH